MFWRPNELGKPSEMQSNSNPFISMLILKNNRSLMDVFLSVLGRPSKVSKVTVNSLSVNPITWSNTFKHTWVCLTILLGWCLKGYKKIFICLDCLTGVYTHLLTADPNVSFTIVRHCKKNVKMRSILWSVFSCVQIKYRHLLRESL